MSKWAKLLARMRRNPQGDFSIDNIRTVCRAIEAYGIRLRAPRGGGSHFTVEYPDGILTIPARRPLKPVYVWKFVEIVDVIYRDEEANSTTNG